MSRKIRKILPALAVVFLALSSAVLAADEGGALSPKNFSSTLSMTTDYVWRGVSQTDSSPAVQGSFDYAHPVGVYLGVWGSNIRFGGGLEMDWYGGFRNTVGALGYDVGVTYYSYPKSHDPNELNFFELAAKLSYTLKFGGVEPTIGVGYSYTPDFTGEDGNAHYVNGKLSFGLPMGFGVAGEVGYQTVEGDKTTGNGGGLDGDDGFDFVHYRLGVSKSDVLGFTLDLSYHNTTESDFLESYAGYKGVADSRLVFTASRTF